jgi:hypothetical protein
MNDVTVRALVVTAVVTAALLIAWLLERRRASRPRKIQTTGLQPGIYLFTSETCAECTSARDLLVSSLGTDGFTEIAWSENPTLFEELQIPHVPASLRVDADGSGRCWFGDPKRMLMAEGP